MCFCQSATLIISVTVDMVTTQAMMINANQWRARRKLLLGKKGRIGGVEEEFGLDLLWKMFSALVKRQENGNYGNSRYQN